MSNVYVLKRGFGFISWMLMAFLISVTVMGILFLTSPMIPADGLHYFLPEGATGFRLVHDLEKKTQLLCPRFLIVFIHFRGMETQLQAGEYQFPPYSTPLTVLSMVTSGNIVKHSLTIVEGLRFQDILSRLQQSSGIQSTLVPADLPLLMKQWGIAYPSLEGLVMPDTYFYIYGTRDIDLLKRAYQSMSDVLDLSWKNRAKGLPYHTPYQALIVASLIEKETAVLSEKPLIAAVILKRWQRGIPLQIDASVLYGLNNRSLTVLTKTDLQTKTPYNTYLKYGLPPTPIASPGRASIDAALHPVKTEALYFAAKGDGTHIFSRTLEEHNQAVQRYLR